MSNPEEHRELLDAIALLKEHADHVVMRVERREGEPEPLLEPTPAILRLVALRVEGRLYAIRRSDLVEVLDSDPDAS